MYNDHAVPRRAGLVGAPATPGSGVDVALIDTGCAPVPGLERAGQARPRARSLARVAGAEPAPASTRTATARSWPASSPANDAGSAPPTATRRPTAEWRRTPAILCIKVATADGGVDVSQVIAAIDWVVQHRYDNGLNIRVLNLSYGTNSTQSYTVDPLAFAAEQAWKQGIVVVAAAGNSGYQKGKGAPGLASPAYDPFLIAVGATTRSGNGRRPKDANGLMAPFSASGPGCGGCRNPDLVAPGSHLQGLRVPGSFVDQSTPPGIIDARFQRGSGTSESAAIVSGAAALVLQKFPVAVARPGEEVPQDRDGEDPGRRRQGPGQGPTRPGRAARQDGRRAPAQQFDERRRHRLTRDLARQTTI